MSLYYAHTLIPDTPEFVPAPQQVAGFLQKLTDLGCAPMEPTLTVGTLSGEVRTGTDPVTGETISIPRRSYATLKDIAVIREKLEAIADYDVVINGLGPPRIPPFSLYTASQASDGTIAEVPFREPYSFQVRSCRRAVLVSMSDWHEEMSSPPEAIVPFGSPCPAKDERGFFHHPHTGAILEVSNAGCARFWIEFEFGKWLLPKIEDSLNLLDPFVVDTAKQHFGTSFVQGCHWG